MTGEFYLVVLGFFSSLPWVNPRREKLGLTGLFSAEFKGPTKEDYVLPCAHYEMGVLAWTEAIGACPEDFPTASDPDGANSEGDKGGEVSLEEFRKKKVEECQARLDKAAAWEAFVLDARCGMRVQTGLETLKWYKKRMGWA